MVVLVKLMDVEAASALVHVHTRVHWALNLNGLGSVAFLRVQLAPVTADVHWLDRHHVSLHVVTVVARCVVRGGHDCLASWVESKVGLVHQLLVEGGVHIGVVVGDGVLVVDTLGVELGASILEQFVQDRFLLVIVDVHTLALDSTTLNSKNDRQIQLDKSNLRICNAYDNAGIKGQPSILLKF